MGFNTLILWPIGVIEKLYNIVCKTKNDMNLELLLKCGYFPRELPHSFNSESFSAITSATGVVLPAELLNNRNTSIPATHN